MSARCLEIKSAVKFIEASRKETVLSVEACHRLGSLAPTGSVFRGTCRI